MLEEMNDLYDVINVVNETLSGGLDHAMMKLDCTDVERNYFGTNSKFPSNRSRLTTDQSWFHADKRFGKVYIINIVWTSRI